MERKSKTLYKEILPALDLFEADRQEALGKQNRQSILLGFISLAVIILIVVFPLSQELKIIIGGLAGIFLLSWAGHFRSKFVSKYKKDLIQIFFSRENIDVTVEPYEHIYENHFNRSAIFREASTMRGEDLIKGKRDGLYFLVSELKVKLNRGMTTAFGDVGPAFQGIYFCGQITKDTGTTLMIHTRDFEYPYPKRIRGTNYETNSPEFDKHFIIEHFDDEKAADILSPEFIKQLVRFKKIYRFPFVLKIIGNHVYLALTKTKDFFRVGFNSKSNSSEVVEKIRKDCEFYFDIVDLLEEIQK